MSYKDQTDIGTEFRSIVEAELQNYSCHRYFKGLFNHQAVCSYSQLDEIIANPLIPPEFLHFISRGQSIDLGAKRVWRNIQNKKLPFFPFGLVPSLMSRSDVSLVLEGVDNFHKEIAIIVREIDKASASLLSNGSLFYSKYQNEAYIGHRDSEPVLVAHLGGAKRWYIYEPQGRRLAGNSPLNNQEMGALVETIDLEPGDVLFVPAGIPHRVETLTEKSLHLAVDLCRRDLTFETVCSYAAELHNNTPFDLYTATDILARLGELAGSSLLRERVSKESSAHHRTLREFRDLISPKF